ncbi:MAG: ABC transporter permease [Actinobacteria bacterium]|nr:ABC transporter permease [Actinomycetota bacterium]
MTTVITVGQKSRQRRRARGRGGLFGLGVAGSIAFVVIAIAAVLALIGPWIAPQSPTQPNLGLAWVNPDATHWFGYDVQGRDVFSRIVAGAQSSMLGPLIVVIVGMVLGTFFALISAWRGGATDTVVSGGMNILFAFPAILLAALAAAVVGAGLWPAVIALIVAYIPYVARLLRGAILQARNQPYVAALEVQGASVVSIWFRHLIPNVLPLIVAQATLLFGYAMLDIAILSYLGLGIQPPAPDWGVMISENQSGILQGYPVPALIASVCIVAVVVSMNVLGERLLDRSGGTR